MFRDILAFLARVTCGFVLSYPACALSLAEAVLLARSNDPIYLSAQANLTASRERSSQASANLLPQISATVNTTDNRRNYEVAKSNQPATNDRYNSNSAQINLTQPIWNHSKWIALTQADITASQTDYQNAAAEQDLLLRLAQAWFDIMLARDEKIFSDTQVKATKQQWEQAKHAFELGLVSEVVVEEAHAKYDQAVADYSGADADQMIKVAALEQILGTSDVLKVPFLLESFAITDLRQGTLVQWLKHAEEKSPLVLAALRGFDAASEEVRKQSASHEPTLDLVATYGRNSQQTGSFPGQNGFKIRQDTIALQLNVPIFSGGGQRAKVAEAIAMRKKSEMDVESAKRNVRQTCYQAWFGWQAGKARQIATSQSLRFSRMSLYSAIRGKNNDMKTELDVLLARQQFYSAIKELQKARYNMIISQLKLKATAGELVDSDLTALDSWMTSVQESLDDGVAPQVMKVMPQAEVAVSRAEKATH